MKRMLIIGGNGFLGSRLAELAKPAFKVYPTYNSRKIEGVHLHLADSGAVRRIVKEISPDVIAFTARFDDIKGFRAALREIRSRFIFISSDAVFDGTKGNYAEDDPTNPLTEYGRKKKEFEDAIQDVLDDYVILRPGYILGKRCKRSVDIRSSGKKEWFDDVYRTPIDVNDLAAIIIELAAHTYTGIIHVACDDIITPYQLACAATNDPMIPIPSPKTMAKDTTLNTARMKRLLSTRPRPFDQIGF